VVIAYHKSLPKDVGLKHIVEAVESLKKFDTIHKSREATSINADHDVRVWASVESLKGLLEAQTYLQEHLDEYVSIMSGKLTIIEKAGMLKSLPIMFTVKRKTSFYASGRFLVALVPAVALTLFAVAFVAAQPPFIIDFITHEPVESLYVAFIGILFGAYLLTFGILFIGYRQQVISKSRFAYLYFPIWALIVLSTGLFLIERAAEALIVLLLIGSPKSFTT
jgi:hypothetical protein